MSETILVTGSSGFIGYHLSKRLLDDGHRVIGIDNENDYYDVGLKQWRRKQLVGQDNFSFYHIDLIDKSSVEKPFADSSIDKVCHLAAQAGVRYSIDHPDSYLKSNMIVFHNIIDLARIHDVANFVYASSSSVYGMSEQQPCSIDDRVDHPISLYAATKKSNELVAHVYSHIYGLPTIGLRFFTVYGPAGRPDMAYYKFALKMQAGEPIDVYNHGKMMRDFTYIDDIVDGIVKSLNYTTDHALFNLGNDQPEQLMDMIDCLEDALGIQAKKNYIGMQPGDVYKTWADISETKKVLEWQPTTSLKDGLDRFVEWFREFH